MGQVPRLVGRDEELSVLCRVLARDGPRAALLTGAAGIGKTRLLQELAEHAEAQGWSVEHAAASPSTTAFSLAPFGHLEPIDLPPAQDPGERIARVVGSLSASIDGGTLLVAVDDVHHLDPASVVLIHQLVSRGSIRVAMTARDGHRVPDALAHLVSNEGATPLGVRPLARPASDELVSNILEGPIDATLGDAIWALAEGNPLFTRELTTFGRAQQSVTRGSTGRWELTGRLEASPVLRDQIGRRLAGLSDETAALLRCLALANPLPLPVVERLGPLEALAELEAAGLVVVSAEQEQPAVALGHSLYGEVTRATAPNTLLTAAARATATAMLAAEQPRDADVVAAAVLRLDIGEPDVDTLLRAADIAMESLDHEQALRFATAAVEIEARPDARLTRARALSATREADAAETDFQNLARLDLGPEWFAGVTLFHAQHLLFSRGDAGAAIDLIQSRLGDLPPAIEGRLRAFLSFVAFFTADYDVAIEAALPLLENDVLPLDAIAGLNFALAVTGQPARLLEIWNRALGDLRAHGPPATTDGPFGGFFFVRLLALWQTGRAPEGDDPYAPVRDLVLPRLDTVEFRAGMDAPQYLIRGHLDRAAVACAESAARMWRMEMQVTTANLEFQVAIEAQRGDVEAARRSLARLDATPPQARAGQAWWVERGRLWTEVAAGDIDAGITASLVLADRHAAEHLHATTSLHDVVRLGQPELVVDRLVAQTARPGATWWDQICCDHARMLSDTDADGLLDVAGRFEAGGLDLLAAEAFAQATRLLDPGTDGVKLATARVHLAELLERCGTASTPALATSYRLLSQRELEVARLAGHGLTNQEIAARLGTAVRTVANQLQRAYDKLGVHDRTTLRGLFEGSPHPEPAPPGQSSR